MSDAREALVALLWEKFGAGPNGPLAAWLTEADCARFADAILAAGWTPPGERVKPSVDDVARAILMATQAADVDPDYAWNVQYPEVQDELLDQARAVLALLPGRTEAEVKAEELREAASAIGTYDEGDVHLWARDADTWLLDRADRIEKEADDDR